MHYSKLEVWQEAIELVLEIYATTAKLPIEERFELAAQMRRAAVSVPSNIAEGEGRRTWRDRSHFYLQARGSVYELETQTFICERLGLFDGAIIRARTTSVGKLINGVLRNWKTANR